MSALPPASSPSDRLRRSPPRAPSYATPISAGSGSEILPHDHALAASPQPRDTLRTARRGHSPFPSPAGVIASVFVDTMSANPNRRLPTRRSFLGWWIAGLLTATVA